MAEDGLFASMDALDPSAGAIEVARTQSAARGVNNIRFDVADLNNLRLPAETYDVVHINMALHHCASLERLVHQVNRSLKPGGIFLVNEFVGATQFQYPDAQVDLVNDLLALLPERLRWNPVAREVKGGVGGPVALHRRQRVATQSHCRCPVPTKRDLTPTPGPARPTCRCEVPTKRDLTPTPAG